MTAQIADVFQYDDRVWDISGISEGELFDPSLLELEPCGTCSACWRGYQAKFAIFESHLVLDVLRVNLLEKVEEGHQRQQGPVINGVAPTNPDDEEDEDCISFFNNHYEGIKYHLEYTGGLLLADGFIDELYVHMGFHSPWKYEKVFELVFEGGVLKAEFDRSEQIAEIRQTILESSKNDDPSVMPTKEEIREFVERAFDRSYRL